MKKNFLALLFFSLFFTSCEQSATSVFPTKDKSLSQNIQYTKIVKLVKENNVETLFNITYLNSVYDKFDNDKQNFLIGFYDSNDKLLDNFTFRLNEKESIETKEIDKNSDFYNNIAFKNRWASYKIISFNDVEEKTVVLDIYESENKVSTISFIKE